MSEVTQEEKCRVIAEWLFGRSLDGFGIFAASGQRLRDRDFDTREEAQRYIDSEDERLTESHRAAAQGVNIQPCVKAHPDFYRDEAANALILEKMPRTLVQKMTDGGWFACADYHPPFRPFTTYPDRKHAIADAGYALALREREGK